MSDKQKLASDATATEIATVVSEALQKAGIDAVLSGGGAAAVYSDEVILSKDLDFRHRSDASGYRPPSWRSGTWIPTVRLESLEDDYDSEMHSEQILFKQRVCTINLLATANWLD